MKADVRDDVRDRRILNGVALILRRWEQDPTYTDAAALAEVRAMVVEK